MLQLTKQNQIRLFLAIILAFVVFTLLAYEIGKIVGAANQRETIESKFEQIELLHRLDNIKTSKATEKWIDSLESNLANDIERKIKTKD